MADAAPSTTTGAVAPLEIGNFSHVCIGVSDMELLENATLTLDVEHRKLGSNPQVLSATPTTVNRELRVPVPRKFAVLREHYNELRLVFKDAYAVVFRAYNEGIAYRFETSLPQNTVKVYDEKATLSFAGDYHVYYPKEDSFFSHNEREFVYLRFERHSAKSSRQSAG